jgi:hypothetical protein
VRTIGGLIETDIYTTEDGLVALKQPGQAGRDDGLCLLSVDQLPEIIGELQALYADRQRWAEAPRE